ncbi:MAG: hypothetical protein EA359_17385 [Balneolaceae bacterium]|jgi:hypothetical protein|nr:MAG: hypothetical protein EA359_17385 [Balneolaceae bacterium]
MKWANLIILVIFFLFDDVAAQHNFIEPDYTLLQNRYYQMLSYEVSQQQEDEESGNSEYPSPRSVMFKSMMIPGWGQIENRQIWKVPIVYGLFAGVGVYTAHLNSQYQDYRAAYYNAVQGADSDLRFGPTPDYLQNVNTNQLQANRNTLRNQRDFMFVVMGLAYGLNILDAYVYAHMRSFDVSDDLSARTIIEPGILEYGSPGIRVSLTLFTR